jgi:protocatechuate 3,4-dioxygenase beta subunit
LADFVFQDDPLLTDEFWEDTERWWRSIGIYQDPNYGGVRLTKNAAGLWEGVRDITLVAEFDLPAIASGRDILDDSPAFEPQHAWGPDKGSHACPMCKYGYQPGVLFWVNSDVTAPQVERWAKWLEELTVARGDKNFKAYLIYTNPQKWSREQLESKLAAIGQSLGLKKLAVTYVPSVDDKATDTYLNRINPATENTVIVYNNRKITDKFVNLEYTEQNKILLRRAIDRAGTDREPAIGKHDSDRQADGSGK